MALGSVQSVCAAWQRCSRGSFVTLSNFPTHFWVIIETPNIRRDRVRRAQFSSHFLFRTWPTWAKSPCPASILSNLQTWRLSWFITRYKVFQISQGRNQVHYRGEEDKGISHLCVGYGLWAIWAMGRGSSRSDSWAEWTEHLKWDSPLYNMLNNQDIKVV